MSDDERNSGHPERDRLNLQEALRRVMGVVERDPAKRITAFGIGIHEGEVRAVLVVNDENTLIIASSGLNHSQAELLCDGYVDGLRESADLPVPFIDAFLNDSDALEALQVPVCDISPADRVLLKQGAIGGLRLATMGYWLDTGDTFAHTFH